MAELVDAPASGAGILTGVEVRVFFWAPNTQKQLNSSCFFTPITVSYYQPKLPFNKTFSPINLVPLAVFFLNIIYHHLIQSTPKWGYILGYLKKTL